MAGPHNQTDLRSVFEGRRVLVTGHTGFKGGWLCLWLRKLGADIVGVALPPPEGPSMCQAINLSEIVDDRTGDIRDTSGFAKSIADVDAELIIHMAAQAIVRQSYETPVDTYLTNVVGTANVLEAALRMPSLRAVIVVTSDKCYENREWVWGYRENDPMGGSDPYSSSKGCAELVTSAYRQSFFADPTGPQLASVRAGNVFGGGDWGADRLIPDIVKATLAGQPTHIRNPASIRPWQHVLEPLSGYLMLAARLLSDGRNYAEGWNFGPDTCSVVDVETLALTLQRTWSDNGPEFVFGKRPEGPHEAGVLRLDSTKAMTRLGWQPRLSLENAVAKTVDWYRRHSKGENMRATSNQQIDEYELMRFNSSG